MAEGVCQGEHMPEGWGCCCFGGVLLDEEGLDDGDDMDVDSLAQASQLV